MKRKVLSLLSVVLLLPIAAAAQSAYFPPAGEWERRTPEQARMDAAKLKEAVDFAIASESKAPRDQELGQAQSFGREPFGEGIGLYKPRGDATGIVIRN